ncbi:hypothetical protein [Mediterranea massiliensis]|uniref:hypothetical protein n=1 Tax=Mediterranea massiliensis TaxID=1841865 RepID=UPI0025A4B65C|nr:hypothetical protein [Mediterranea massiliensis]MDM8335841.1 hypothetical protein [Mediterranea massiliensis]
MRYIRKGSEPTCLTEFKKAQEEAGIQPLYANFREKEPLNNLLRAEQHHICCYCQQRLTHFQRDKEGGAHNEHLIPQEGAEGDTSKQLDYGNIYACCIDSRGMSANLQHCGESKHDRRIHGFIQQEDCTEYFKYNSLGEILPNGEYDTWEEYNRHQDTLSGNIKEAYREICTLNLNCPRLRNDRRGDFFALLSIIKDMSKEEIGHIMTTWNEEEYYLRFIDMLLYFMKKKK